MNDGELDKELAKKVINPLCFFDIDLQVGFEINVEGHENSFSNVVPTVLEMGIETAYIKKSYRKWLLFTRDQLINISLNIIYFFQLAFIRITKKINEVVKLNCSKTLKLTKI